PARPSMAVSIPRYSASTLTDRCVSSRLTLDASGSPTPIKITGKGSIRDFALLAGTGSMDSIILLQGAMSRLSSSDNLIWFSTISRQRKLEADPEHSLNDGFAPPLFGTSLVRETGCGISFAYRSQPVARRTMRVLLRGFVLQDPSARKGRAWNWINSSRNFRSAKSWPATRAPQAPQPRLRPCQASLPPRWSPGKSWRPV